MTTRALRVAGAAGARLTASRVGRVLPLSTPRPSSLSGGPSPTCRGHRGAALFMTFLLMLVISSIALGVGTFAFNSMQTGKTQLLDKQATSIAEAGWQRARQALAAGTWSPAYCQGSTCTESFGGGEYVVVIDHEDDNTYTITSSGYIPNATSYTARRQIAESEIEPSSTGTNLSLAATMTASSSGGSHPASDAKDGSSSSYWEAGSNGSNQWLRLDFGSAQTISYMKLTEKNNRINALTVEYSSDGSSWATVPGLSAVESPGKTWVISCTATSARYVRAYFTDVDSSKKASVTEFESYASSTLDTPLTYETQW